MNPKREILPDEPVKSTEGGVWQGVATFSGGGGTLMTKVGEETILSRELGTLKPKKKYLQEKRGGSSKGSTSKGKKQRPRKGIKKWDSLQKSGGGKKARRMISVVWGRRGLSQRGSEEMCDPRTTSVFLGWGVFCGGKRVQGQREMSIKSFCRGGGGRGNGSGHQRKIRRAEKAGVLKPEAHEDTKDKVKMGEVPRKKENLRKKVTNKMP